MKIKNTLEYLRKLNNPKNRLTFISYAESTRTPGGTVTRRINCKCSCGKDCVVNVRDIVSGLSNSCGCYMQDRRRESHLKYFPRIKALYNVWFGMIERCYNENHPSYKYYGGRGVKVCDKWRFDYQSFLDWALSNGWKRGLQIDKDILGDGFLYSPETCKIVTASENGRNKRTTKKYHYNGKMLCIGELSEISGLSSTTIWKRINRHGWSVSKSVETAKRNKK